MVAASRTLLSGSNPSPFLNQVERTTELFAEGDDHSADACEDVRQILRDVRSQYDVVHHEAEKKFAQLEKIRETIAELDLCKAQKDEENHRLEDQWNELGERYEETKRQIHETQTCRKVYEHMLARIQKEQAILKQKMMKMEQHHSRKKQELAKQTAEWQRMHVKKVQDQRAEKLAVEQAEQEREIRDTALQAMNAALDARQEAIARRSDFVARRHEVALEAANEAFNKSAGRLRKHWAIEQLAGNMLQKTAMEQAESYRDTEDGFRQIREVTGLADVMDIVHKFLNRQVEGEQLKGSVKDAESRLEALRQEFNDFKTQTEATCIDPTANTRSGDVYKEVEHHEARLNEALKLHEQCRVKLQRTSLDFSHVRRWCTRMGQSLRVFGEPVKVESPADLSKFFEQLNKNCERLRETVETQVRNGKLSHKELEKQMKKRDKEHQEQLKDDRFVKANCRIPATADGRPPSRSGQADEDPMALFVKDRHSFKNESIQCIQLAEKKADQQKKALAQKKPGGS